MSSSIDFKASKRREAVYALPSGWKNTSGILSKTGAKKGGIPEYI